MKTTLRTITALFVALVLIQCTDEEIRVTKKDLAVSMAKVDASRNIANAFTIGATPLNDYDDQVAGYDFQFYMKGSGTITIYWGDGSQTSHTFTDTWDTFTHGYSSTGPFKIQITGDIKNITYFDTYYGMGSFNAIDFKRLVNLEEVSIGLTESSSVLDFSHNPKLSILSLAGMQQLDKLILPKRHNIRTVNLDGPFAFNTNDIDGIIDNIHNNAVSKNLMGGTFTLPASWYQEEGDRTMVGPPSSQALQKLRTLQDMLGWSIYPALDAPNM